MIIYNKWESGVKGYDVSETSITVYFKKGKAYVYTYDSCGSRHVENMIYLAMDDDGLNTYINRHKPKYARRLNSGSGGSSAFPYSV